MEKKAKKAAEIQARKEARAIKMKEKEASKASKASNIRKRKHSVANVVDSREGNGGGVAKAAKLINSRGRAIYSPQRFVY